MRTPLRSSRARNAWILGGLVAALAQPPGQHEHGKRAVGLHGPAQRGVIQRGEYDAADALGGKLLHDLDLLRAVALLQRPFPQDLDAELLPGLARPGLHRFPKHVRRPRRDHGDARRTRLFCEPPGCAAPG